MSNGEHDECMICLSGLLEGESDDDDDDDDIYIETTRPEVGAVWPCGHCFHLKCWNKWKKEKCPICNQPANLFSKIFISAPASTNTPSRGELDIEERVELERYRRLAREEGQERMLLRDMGRQVADDPEGAKMMMTMMMMVQSRDLRKAERALEHCEDECEMTKDILSIAQTELEQANSELAELKPKTKELEEEVDRLKKMRKDERAASHRTDRDKKQIATLQEKLDRAKDKLALKNKQLSRRNKELQAKRKLISSHKVELTSKGKEQQKAVERSNEELKRTKKELELLKELDSFTMEDSSGSLGLSLIWD